MHRVVIENIRYKTFLKHHIRYNVNEFYSIFQIIINKAIAFIANQVSIKRYRIKIRPLTKLLNN